MLWMLQGGYELISAAYEVCTVVMDIVLNREYIERDWAEEYTLSIAFLLFSGVVMGLLGMALEQAGSNRYVHNDSLNKCIAFVIGVLQLRVLVETFFIVSHKKRKTEFEKRNGPIEELVDTGGENGQSHPTSSQSLLIIKEDRRLNEGLKFATFAQSIARDLPVFIITANATVHYRSWKLLDLLAVLATAVTLVNAMASYLTKQNSGFLALSARFFILGQFIFRLGALLLVAMTKGLVVAAYAFFITMSSIIWTVKLRLAHPSPSLTAQIPRALLFFPFHALLTVNGAKLTARVGDAHDALADPRLHILHLWRIAENVIGIALAFKLPRYVDFGYCPDYVIVVVGGGCTAVFLLSWAIFDCAARAHKKASDEAATAQANQLELSNASPVHPQHGYSAQL